MKFINKLFSHEISFFTLIRKNRPKIERKSWYSYFYTIFTVLLCSLEKRKETLLFSLGWVCVCSSPMHLPHLFNVCLPPAMSSSEATATVNAHSPSTWTRSPDWKITSLIFTPAQYKHLANRYYLPEYIR